MDTVTLSDTEVARGKPPRRWARRASAIMVGPLLVGAVLIASGAVDTPVWSPVASCQAPGFGASMGPIEPGEQIGITGGFFAAASGGEVHVQTLKSHGSIARLEIEIAGLDNVRSGGRMGMTAADIGRLRAEGQLRPIDAIRITAHNRWQPAFIFSAAEPGEYQLTGYTVVYRAGWRKKTCFHSAETTVPVRAKD